MAITHPYHESTALDKYIQRNTTPYQATMTLLCLVEKALAVHQSFPLLAPNVLYISEPTTLQPSGDEAVSHDASGFTSLQY